MTLMAFSCQHGTQSSEQRPSFAAMSGYNVEPSLVTSGTMIGRDPEPARPADTLADLSHWACAGIARSSFVWPRYEVHRSAGSNRMMEQIFDPSLCRHRHNQLQTHLPSDDLMRRSPHLRQGVELQRLAGHLICESSVLDRTADLRRDGRQQGQSIGAVPVRTVCVAH